MCACFACAYVSVFVCVCTCVYFVYVFVLVCLRVCVYMHVCICVHEVVQYIHTLFIHLGAAVAVELVALFAGDLNPVAPKAQKKVPVPEG